MVQIRSVGVIGAGQMGSGIAHVCALGGYDVLLHDVSPDRIKASLAQIENTLTAVQSILIRARGVVCLRGLLSDFGLEVLYIPPVNRIGGVLNNLRGQVDLIALADIGRALRAEFLTSHRDMVQIETDDGAQVIVYAIEVRATVLAATRIQLIEDQ
mgnify:CR=1 FL=1